MKRFICRCVKYEKLIWMTQAQSKKKKKYLLVVIRTLDLCVTKRTQLSNLFIIVACTSIWKALVRNNFIIRCYENFNFNFQLLTSRTSGREGFLEEIIHEWKRLLVIFNSMTNFITIFSYNMAKLELFKTEFINFVGNIFWMFYFNIISIVEFAVNFSSLYL